MSRENQITGEIVDAAMMVHRELGPGLLESVYERILGYELTQRHLDVVHQVPVSVQYKGIVFEEGFRADLVVERSIVVELKSIDAIKPLHKKQLLTYLRLMKLPVGLLINFNVNLLKDGVTRVSNGAPNLTPDSAPSAPPRELHE
jgi:GxxExxY protein